MIRFVDGKVDRTMHYPEAVLIDAIDLLISNVKWNARFNPDPITRSHCMNLLETIGAIQGE